jgi:hypothetical protein
MILAFGKLRLRGKPIHLIVDSVDKNGKVVQLIFDNRKTLVELDLFFGAGEAATLFEGAGHATI